jgi:hypothetical protein
VAEVAAQDWEETASAFAVKAVEMTGLRGDDPYRRVAPTRAAGGDGLSSMPGNDGAETALAG